MQRKLSHSQNFLRNPKLVEDLIRKSQLIKDDIVYEIGPGKGTITFQLARFCKKVIAIEFDEKLYQQLKRQFNSYKNIEIVNDDFLKYTLPDKGNYKIFSNIPFNLTTDIVEKITGIANPPEDSFLIIQKESAERFAGLTKESLKSLLIKPFFKLKIVSKLRRTDFKPKPKVDTVLLQIRKRKFNLVSDKELYQDFIVYSLSQWRPTLQESIKQVMSKEQFNNFAQKFDVRRDAKPTDLSFEQWVALFKSFEKQATAREKQIVTNSYKKLKRQQQGLQKVHRTRN